MFSLREIFQELCAEYESFYYLDSLVAEGTLAIARDGSSGGPVAILYMKTT